MQKQNYILAALDMDGTLLNTQHEVTPFTRDVLARAARAGKIMALATGRGLSELKEHLPLFSDVRYVISENGACIYDAHQHRCLSRTSIPDDKVEAIIALSSKIDMVYEFFMNDQAHMRWPEQDDLSDYHIENFRPVFQKGCIFREDMFEYYREDHLKVDKMNLYFRTEAEREHARRILAPMGVTVAGSIGLGLEISAAGVNKAYGLRRLCEALNVPIEQTLAIGDAGNDIDILRAAGLGVAMGNAEPEVLAAAGAVTEDCDHDGAAKAILLYVGVGTADSELLPRAY